jgi:hypothetical protein
MRHAPCHWLASPVSSSEVVEGDEWSGSATKQEG